MSLINSTTRTHEEVISSKTRAHVEGLTVRGDDQTPSMSGRVQEEYMRMTPSANGQSYVRLASGGQRIYRGRVRQMRMFGIIGRCRRCAHLYLSPPLTSLTRPWRSINNKVSHDPIKPKYLVSVKTDGRGGG